VPAPPERRWALLLAAVGLLALLAHARTLGNGFVYDDARALGNAVVTGPFDPAAIAGSDFWGQGAGGVGTWRPLAVASLWVDQHLGGGAPLPFHATNLVLHALTAIALVLALRRAVGDGRLALAAGALFATLAINTEAVAAVVGRADLLAALLGVLAWATLPPPGARLAPARVAGAAGLTLAALLAKESALVIPPFLVAAELLLGDRPWRARLGRAAALAGALAAAVGLYLALRAASVPFGAILRAENNNPLLGQPLPTRVLSGLALLTRAARLILVPLQLAPDYSFAEILPERMPPSADVLLGALLAILLAAGAVAARRRSPAAALGLTLVLLGWAAQSHILLPLPAIFAERLLYLPAAGAAIAVVAGAAALHRRGRAGLAVALLVLLAAGNLARGVVRDGDWRSPATLFGQAVRDTPRCARAWLNLAAARIEARRLEDGLADLGRAAAIAPEWCSPHTMAGATLDQLGDPARAEAELRLAVRLDPVCPSGAYNLALFLARHARHAEAAAVLDDYLARVPRPGRELELRESLRARIGG
jgi:protein O-mannosyl-transferase